MNWPTASTNLRRNPRLRILWVFWLVIVICGFAIQTLMPGILDQEFSRSSDEAVLINAIFGISALAINVPLAGLVGGRLAWPLLLGTAILMAVGLWMVAWAPTYGLVLILSAVAGAGRSGVMLVNQAIMMSNTKPEYFGRVMAYVLMAFGLQSITAPGWGIIADIIGGRETLFLVGVIVVGATALDVPRLDYDAAATAGGWYTGCIGGDCNAGTCSPGPLPIRPTVRCSLLRLRRLC